LTFSQIFSINFGLLGALSGLRQTPPGALYPAGDRTHSFVPLRNKLLATTLQAALAEAGSRVPVV